MYSLRYDSTPEPPRKLLEIMEDRTRYFGRQEQSIVSTRTDWQNNHDSIKAGMLKLMKKLGRWPTNEELSREVGLHVNTIASHLKNLDVPSLFDGLKKQFAPLADDILLSTIKAARQGNTKAQELYYQIVLGWQPNMRLTITPEKLEYTPEEIERLRNDANRRANS